MLCFLFLFLVMFFVFCFCFCYEVHDSCVWSFTGCYSRNRFIIYAQSSCVSKNTWIICVRIRLHGCVRFPIDCFMISSSVRYTWNQKMSDGIRNVLMHIPPVNDMFFLESSRESFTTMKLEWIFINNKVTNVVY